MDHGSGGHWLDTGAGPASLDPAPEPPRAEQWRRAHEAAQRLRTSLIMLDVPAAEVDKLTARDDATGRPRVLIPPLSPEAVELVLAALGPAIGPASPHLIGRRDGPPVLPAESF